MKKTLLFIALAVCSACAMVSCSEDVVENPYAVEPMVKVVKSDILFNQRGGTGTIEVAAQGSYTATCEANWVTLSQSGNTITVNVQPVPSVEGRAAAVEIVCGQDKVIATIQQLGIVYNNETFGYAGGTFTIDASELGAYTIENEADWLTFSEEKGIITVTVAPNKRPQERTAQFTIKGTTDDLVYVISQTYDVNLSGKYEMYFYTSSAETTVNYIELTLTRDAKDPTIYTISGLLDDFQVKAQDGQLVIKNGTYIGGDPDLSEYYYIVVSYSTLDGKSGYYSVSTDPKYDIYFGYEYNFDDDCYEIYLLNSAPLFNAERLSQGFHVYVFSTPPSVALATANRLGSALTVRKPVMYQVE